MQVKIVLAALAGTAFAADINNLQPRQTMTAPDSACLSVYKTAPTPPPALVSELAKNPVTDPCSFSVPSSLSKDWSAYTSSAASWFKAHSSDLTKCPGYDQVKSKSPIDCKAGGSGGSKTTGGSGSAETTGSGTGTATGGAASSTKTGGAARETGVVMAFVAAAGMALAAL